MGPIWVPWDEKHLPPPHHHHHHPPPPPPPTTPSSPHGKVLHTPVCPISGSPIMVITHQPNMGNTDGKHTWVSCGPHVGPLRGKTHGYHENCCILQCAPLVAKFHEWPTYVPQSDVLKIFILSLSGFDLTKILYVVNPWFNSQRRKYFSDSDKNWHTHVSHHS